MKRMIQLTIVLAVALCLSICQAQTLPSNFMGVGLGFQATSIPQASGWLEIDKALPDITIGGLVFHSYGGAATDYFGSSTSARVDTKIVFLHKAWFTAGSLQGAGAAFNQNGIGGSFALGGWATAGIGKLLGVPGACLAASATWQKDDIAVAAGNGTLATRLETLGSRGTFRFGFGKTW